MPVRGSLKKRHPKKPKWAVETAELISIHVTKNQYKKVLAEIGKLIYTDITNQLQKSIFSKVTESNNSQKQTG